MKKNIVKALTFMVVSAAMTVFNACDEVKQPVENPDVTPVLEVTVASVAETTAELSVKAENVVEVAYVVSDEMSDFNSAAVIFATGKKVEKDQTKIVLTDLEANKEYWVYFAANIDNTSYSNIVEVSFTTVNYQFNKMLTLIDTEHMGYKVRITVPDEVRNEPEKYAIRYNFASLLDVLLAKYEMERPWAMNLLENAHGCRGWQETTRDTTVYINPWNEYRQNPDGSYYIDPTDDQMVPIHNPIAPNEPYLFTAGQYRYGHIDELGWGWSYGSDDKDTGYYIPLWDQDGWVAEYGVVPSKSNLVFDPVTGYIDTGEEKYWNDNSFGKNGTIQSLFFFTKAPELLETDFEVIVEDVTPVNAKISFLTDEKTYVYSYVICNDATYKTMVNDLLLGYEDWLQWFVCSYYGMFHLQFPSYQGNTTISASDYNNAPLASENLYHILVTVTGDENGSAQKFIHETFETTAKVMGTPVIEVTPVEDNQNEYFAKFNIKAPNKDIARAAYAADYKREFLFEANSDVKYPALCQNLFSEDDIAAINSDEGLEIQINSTDGQIVRLAVLGYNIEETPNDLYSPEKAGKACSAVADCRTKLLDMVPHVNSPLFNTLEGQWTATAKVMIREYDKNNNIQEYTKTKTANIEILQSIPTPALTQDVYDIYSAYGYDETATNAFYDDFKREAGIFNDYRLTYRNRLLCLGWFDEDPYYPTASRLALADPFDLFINSQYSCIDNAQIFYDFGPKWYLEIDANGNVTLPFDQWETPPMSFWQRTVFFMGAYNYEQNHGYRGETISSREGNEGEVIMPAEFPVEVVNNDKFIIKSVMAPLYDEADAKLYPHYPNAIGGWGAADAQILRPIVSEITFTRGWTKTAGQTNAAKPANYVQPAITGGTATPVIVKSMTPIKNIEVPVFEQKEMYVLTEDMLKSSIPSYLDKKYNRK